jgi:hypothetical protein
MDAAMDEDFYKSELGLSYRASLRAPQRMEHLGPSLVSALGAEGPGYILIITLAYSAEISKQVRNWQPSGS